MPSSLIGAVTGPRRTQGIASNPAPGTTPTLVSLKGPGLFISAAITKQGGSTDLCFVTLDIDGQNLVNVSIAALFNQALVQDNSYGVMVFKSTAGLDTVTIGWPYPITFQRDLVLRIVVNEPGVVQVLANVLSAS